jgi:hypothetical protein
MEMALLAMPNGVCAPFEIGTLGALYEPAEIATESLIHSDERLIRNLISVLDKQLLSALDTRSPDEFAAVREKVLSRYIRALRAVTDTMSNLASQAEIEQLYESAMTVLATDIEKQRGKRFGDALTDQALFTLWTMGKIRALGREIEAVGKPSDRKADRQLHMEYQVASLWAQFHLDCVLAAIKFKKDFSEAIQASLCDGLRATVNTYAIMKEALALRLPNRLESAPADGLPWDEEDEKLLASSMRDINAFSGDS